MMWVADWIEMKVSNMNGSTPSVWSNDTRGGGILYRQ